MSTHGRPQHTWKDNIEMDLKETGLEDANRIHRVYRVSQEEWTKLRESVPYVKIYRYNPKHLYPKLNGYGDNGQRSLKL